MSIVVDEDEIKVGTSRLFTTWELKISGIIYNMKQTQIWREKDALDDCASAWIPELTQEHPEWSEDQVVAVAYEKCRNGEAPPSESIGMEN